jgi:hypothetical protein
MALKKAGSHLRRVTQVDAQVQRRHGVHSRAEVRVNQVQECSIAELRREEK